MSILASMLWHAPLLGLLMAAALVDIRQRRIPNTLTLLAALSGLGQSLLPQSPIHVGTAAAGLFLGLGLSMMLLLIGAWGGGDVKMTAAIGAWVGPWGVVLVFAAAALLSMSMVLLWALQRRQARSLMSSTAVLAARLVSGRELAVLRHPGQEPAFQSVGKPLPFAVPLGLATLLTLLGVAVLRGQP